MAYPWIVVRPINASPVLGRGPGREKKFGRLNATFNRKTLTEILKSVYLYITDDITKMI